MREKTLKEERREFWWIMLGIGVFAVLGTFLAYSPHCTEMVNNVLTAVPCQ